MDNMDPISGCDFEMAEVCAFPPTDFEFVPWKLCWEDPCWVNADIILRPLTMPTKEKFVFNLDLPHRWDAFAKTPWAEQFWAAFSPRFNQLTGPYRSAWFNMLFECQQKLKQGIADTSVLFQEPFRFVPRQQFTTVDLATILMESPEQFCAYLAFEKRTSEFAFLRIHSKPPFLGTQPRCLWYEKRLPEQLHREDIVSWFLATIRRLPKKQQPDNAQPWIDRLLHFEPQLSIQTGMDKPWLEKSKIVLVYGPTSKVGYRGLTHFERRDIRHIIRRGEIVTIAGQERFRWANRSDTQIERVFYLLAFDEAAARRAERQLLSGEKVHFGLGEDIIGIVSRSGHVIHAMNAAVETIRQLCVEPDLDMELLGSPKYKLKLYQLTKRGGFETEGG